MSNRRFSLAFSLLFFMAIASLQHDNAVRAQGIKDVLDSYDAQFLSHFKLSLIVKSKCNIGADQDPSTFTLRVTGNDGTYALAMSRGNLGASRYTSKADRLDYNNAGDLTVSNLKGRTIFNNRKSWKVRSEYDNVILSKAGQKTLSSSALAPRLELYPANHQDPANLFFRYILPLGRGYSQLLEAVTSSTLVNGIATVTGPGSLFSADKGIWRLEIDTTREYLVRSASFSLPSHSYPVFTCRSYNYLKAETPLFGSGELSFPIRNYNITTTVGSYAASADNTLYDESSNLTTAYPSNTSVMDFSQVDAEGMPFVLVPLPKDMPREILE